MKTAHNSLKFSLFFVFRFSFFGLSPLCLFAQASGVPLNAPTYHLLDRLSVVSDVPSEIHPELKFFSRQDVAEYALAVDSASPNLTRLDRRDIAYILADNNEYVGPSYRPAASTNGWQTPETVAPEPIERRGLFGIFWRSPANFFEVNTPHFLLRANPMLNFAFQKSEQEDGILFANQRGLEVRGEVDNRLFFYTNFLETQTRFPEYVFRYIQKNKAVPGNGLYKNFKSQIFDIEKGRGFDYSNAVAYIGFQATRHVGVQLGHGKHFIGNGYRSMFLSDFSNNYFYLKLSTRVWKFDYQNLFLEITPSTAAAEPGDRLLPKKFAAMHYLNFKPTRNLAFGFFEATIFNRSQDFELQYLNPIILYRTVEASIGSPDNVLIGVDFRWNFWRRFQLYGQAMLDEFNFNFIFQPEERGWRNNKSGLQAGLKYFNALGINHLDLQAEYNAVRPYTYSHYDTLNSYTHYHQPLAHPLGANFREIVLLARYQPFPKWVVQARYIRSNYGENTATQNWGGDPLLSNRDFVQEYNNEIGQGVGASQSILGAELNWQFFHNMFLDLRFFLRDKDSDNQALDLKTTLFGAGLRMNVWNQNHDF
ncbi:MAG: capsule assembly Wzi family protein [Saprospiraceae bacterium]